MLSVRSQRIQFCLYSSLVHRNDETWGGGQIEDSVLKLRPPPPSPSETLSLYGGQLDRIRRTLFGWQTSRATAVQDAATSHRENYSPRTDLFLSLIETQLHNPFSKSNNLLIFLKNNLANNTKVSGLVIIFIPPLIFSRGIPPKSRPRQWDAFTEIATPFTERETYDYYFSIVRIRFCP